ncbi:MAG: DUF86 domain-containing protein [Gemmatimonadetes bacterium]|nr:DUF86 domain-containing protein [Gemmatimonadota bacterium]
MPVDRELVTRKIALILGDLRDLEPLTKRAPDRSLNDQVRQLAAERLLERMIGRMLDINYHVITERDGLPPKDFYESFLRLGHLGVLPSDLARAMAPAAGLRNRLAHEYHEIDHAKVQEAAAQALVLVPKYLDAVRKSLEP